jgi:hypothetical protein
MDIPNIQKDANFPVAPTKTSSSGDEEATPPPTTDDAGAGAGSGGNKRQFWMIAAAVVVALALAGVAVGLGVGLGGSDSSSSDATSLSAAQQQQQNGGDNRPTTPTMAPTGRPTTSTSPTMMPSDIPSDFPTLQPSVAPSDIPSFRPSVAPSERPSLRPSVAPSDIPSSIPSSSPTDLPTTSPTDFPTRPPISSRLTFRIKMHWERSYYWQEEWDERQYCLECATCSQLTSSGQGEGCDDRDDNDGTDCQNQDQLWIQDCNGFRGSRKGNAEFEIIRGRKGDQIKIHNKDLCWERATKLYINLVRCDADETRQLWLGFDPDKPFDLRPLQQNFRPQNYGDPVEKERCVSQHHHPKNSEVLFLEECRLGYKWNTALWEAI